MAETRLAPAATIHRSTNCIMLTTTRKVQQVTDLKYIFDNVLDIEHLDSYLTSISISLIGNLVDASAPELEEATLSPQQKW